MDRFGDPWLAPTFDHVVPRSRRGDRKIVCCSRCNHVKRDLMPEEWAAFMAANPRWWLLTDRALRLAHREHRLRHHPPRKPVVLPSRFTPGAVRIAYTEEP